MEGGVEGDDLGDLRKDVGDCFDTKQMGRVVKGGEIRTEGDLSENAEYDEAKKEQAKLEEEIKRLTHIRDHAEVVSGTTTRVGVGVTVTLEVLEVSEALKEDYNFDLEPGDPDYVDVGASFVYAIVGSEEAKPEQNRISLDSELGRLLDGKRKKDEIVMETSDGDIRYKLVKIEATKRRN